MSSPARDARGPCPLAPGPIRAAPLIAPNRSTGALGSGRGLTALEPVGNYAVQPTFSDGHDSGLYSWDYLYFLGSQEDKLWADYEARLLAAGVARDTPMPDKAAPSCASR